MKPHPTNSKPRIAPGHNPDKLTVEQVGKGWRLLSESEHAERSLLRTTGGGKLLASIQRWSGKWDDTHWNGGDPEATFRTRKPPGYFLPKKPKPSPRQPDKVKGVERSEVMLGDCPFVPVNDFVRGTPVLVLDLSPEAHERRVENAAKALAKRLGRPNVYKNWLDDMRAVLASLGDTPAGEGRGK